MSPAPDITRMLLDLRAGQRQVMDQLLPLVYDELRLIAQRHRAKQKAGQTLNTTALVHEVYLKLIDQTRVPWQDRIHFFAVAARAMRFIMIDYARQQNARKRGGDQVKVSLDDVVTVAQMEATDLLALDAALERLAQRDQRLAQVVECRFFGGLTIEETAAVLSVGARTVQRDWQKARLLLYRDMRTDI